MAKKKELTSGQTSDQNIESINLDVLPEVEEGYKPKFECNDLSEFFTPKDFSFMLIDFPKQFETYKSRLDKNNYSSFGTSIIKYYKKFRLYIYPTFVEFYESNFRHEANDYNDGYNEALRDVLELLSSESGVVIKVNV